MLTNLFSTQLDDGSRFLWDLSAMRQFPQVLSNVTNDTVSKLPDAAFFLMSLTSACIDINYQFAVYLGGRNCLSSQRLGINFSCVCAGVYAVYWCLDFMIVISVNFNLKSRDKTWHDRITLESKSAPSLVYALIRPDHTERWNTRRQYLWYSWREGLKPLTGNVELYKAFTMLFT